MRMPIATLGTLAALPLWLVVGFVRADEAEDKAVKAIQELGGLIIRDRQAKDKPIVGVKLSKSRVTDAELKHLAGLQQLKALDLIGTKVTDAGLKHLVGLKQLQVLILDGTKVTAKGKADLKKALPNLKIY